MPCALIVPASSTWTGTHRSGSKLLPEGTHTGAKKSMEYPYPQNLDLPKSILKFFEISKIFKILVWEAQNFEI